LHGKVIFSPAAASPGVDPEIDVDLGTIIELADRFGVALVAIVLSVNFIIHCG
jgi:hypothetical protein